MKAIKGHMLKSNEDQIVNVFDGAKFLCFASCQMDFIEYMELDHMQAASVILARQKSLINGMKQDSRFASEILKVPGMTDYFAYDETKTLVPSKLFFIEYYNDAPNSWLISRRFNRDKSNKNSLKWLQFHRAQYYGTAFINAISPLRSDGILLRTKDGQGLAEAAQKWLLMHHAMAVALVRPILNIEQVAIKNSREATDKMEIEGDEEGARKGMGLAKKCRLLTAILETEELFETRSPKAMEDIMMEVDENLEPKNKHAIQAFIKAGKEAYDYEYKKTS